MGVRCTPKFVVNFFLNGPPFSHVTQSKFTSPPQYLGMKTLSIYALIKTLSIYALIKTLSIYALIKTLSIYALIKTLSLGLFMNAQLIATFAFRCVSVKCLFSEKATQLLYLTKVGFNLSPALPILSMSKEVPRDPFHLTFN
ncbi:MAG: hypothetical protein ACI9WR_001622 [Paracoccaceae bacterium]|jgi:hypothetical protein